MCYHSVGDTVSDNLVDWHKLTFLVLTCRKTPINQSINQSINITLAYPSGTDFYKILKHIIVILDDELNDVISHVCMR